MLNGDSCGLQSEVAFEKNQKYEYLGELPSVIAEIERLFRDVL